MYQGLLKKVGESLVITIHMLVGAMILKDADFPDEIIAIWGDLKTWER